MKIGKLVLKRKQILLAMTCSILLIIGYLLIYNVKGEPNKETTLPEFHSEDGKIKITMRNTAATSGYRWGTVGWAITRKPIPETSNGGIKDYDAKRDGERAIILYEDKFTNSKGKLVKPCKKHENDGAPEGMTETDYKFDEEYVLNKLNISLPNLKKKETLYLHGVFVTYKLNENGTREYYQDLSNSREFIYNWKGICDCQLPIT